MISTARYWTGHTGASPFTRLLGFANALGATYRNAFEAARLAENEMGLSDEQLAARGMTREDVLRRIRETACRG